MLAQTGNSQKTWSGKMEKMEDKPGYVDHRKRLRARFRKNGTEGMHDYEVLELLLTYAIARKDVKPYAKELIKRFGNLSGVLDASQQELESVLHIGPISSTLIRLVKAIGSLYLAEKMKQRDVLSSPQAVLEFARMRLSGLPHEAFMVVFLNTKNKVLDHKIIQEGTVDRAAVYPRRIIEEALSRHATSVNWQNVVKPINFVINGQIRRKVRSDKILLPVSSLPSLPAHP
jgi:DNA repair protein RadC